MIIENYSADDKSPAIKKFATDLSRKPLKDWTNLKKIRPLFQRAEACALRTVAGAIRSASRYFATVRRAITIP